MRKYSFHVFAVLLYAVCIFETPLLHAQGSNLPYQIRSIEYVVDGNVRAFALNARLERFSIGNQYATQSELDAIISEQQLILNNLRQLDSAVVVYALVPGDTHILVDVTITVVESGNFIVLPRPKYSTSDGWELGLRIRDYNFLGTLEQFNIAADVLLPTDGNNRLNIRPSVLFPFQLGGLDWYWRSEFGAEIPLSAQAEEVEDVRIVFDNAIGIYIPILQYRWNLEFTQGVQFSRMPTDDLYLLRNRLSFGTEFTTEPIHEALGRLRYRPVVSAQVKYRLDDQEVKEDERGFDLSFDHSLGFERIIWEQNLREGLALKLENKNTYNTFKNYLKSQVGLEFIGHFAYSIIGISGRLGSVYHFRLPVSTSHSENVGQYGRGILDSRARGNIVIYENFDIRLAGFKNKNTLEAQGGIFFDTVLAFDTSRPFSIDEHVHIGVGIEGIGYFLNSRSVFLRLSIGFDPLRAWRTKTLFGDDNLEIFFGIGHHY